MCGNTFILNWNDFSQEEKYFDIHVVYENTHLSIFIMMFFVADAYDSMAYLENVMCFYQ